MQEDPACSWFCNTFLAPDTHHPLLWDTGGWSHPQGRHRSHVQGMVKIQSRAVQSLPQWELGASQWGTQSSDPAFPEAGLGTAPQGTESCHLHTKAPKGSWRWGSLLWLCASSPAHLATAAPRSWTSHGAPGSFPSTSPWCSTQDIGQTAAQTRSKASYTPHHKAAEELTPAFSFSSVYISVKYIIYSSIGLIVIYYSLELLLSFPYFNHIYASNFAYTSYCLEFVIEIHRIKLK